jgi:hypothetical protein
MRTILRAALAAALLSLAGCGGGSADVVSKVQAGIVKGCDFIADYEWLRTIVAKLDVTNTATAIDGAVTLVCRGVNAKYGKVALLISNDERPCPKGEIVVDGKRICIEGEKIEPNEGE